MSSLIVKALLSAGLSFAAISTAHAGNSYSVDLNKTEVVYLPENAGAVLIGNPEIADVSVHSANTLFVIGRGYGETNLIVLNHAGQKIMNADIQVINKLSSNGVRLYNGTSRQTYSCAPYCQPSPILGDVPAFISENSGTRSEINNNPSTASPSAGPFSSNNSASNPLDDSIQPSQAASGLSRNF